MKNSRSVKCRSALVLLSALLIIGYADGQADANNNKGAPLVVQVTWDDAYKTAATGVYIEAYTFDFNYVKQKSFVLKMVKAGRYEADLPPGVYDVFVSDAISIPRCRRVSIEPGHGEIWNLMLEHDDVYLQR